MRDHHQSIDEQLRAAVKRHRAGELERAAELYDQILEQQPQKPQALHLRATLHLQLDQPEPALAMIERAMTQAGRQPELLLNRASAHLALNQPAAAARDAEAVAGTHPRVFGAWFNLGLACAAMDRWADAAEALAKARELRPDDARCQLEWRIAELRRPEGQWHELPTDLLQQTGRLTGILAELVRSLSDADEDQAAARLARRVANELPDDPDRQLDWIKQTKRAGRSITATGLAETLIERHPTHSRTRLLLATELQTRGRIEAACRHYVALLDHEPEHWQAHSNYLIALQLDPDTTPEALEQAHAAWARRHTAPPDALPPRIDRRPLRIGWFTPRLLAGPMTSFFAPILEAFPRAGVEHWLYQCHPASDRTTPRFVRAADHFVDASTLDDETLVERARKDQLALAVDLSGHAPHHRLRAFARRLAPVQLSWLDYFHPTGVPAIDGFISDRVLEACGRDDPTSNPLLLPTGRLCYAPPPGAPDPDPEPADGGPLRLACFNRIAKIGPQVLAAWAEILRRLPEAELALRCRQLDDGEIRADFIERARAAGLDAERLSLKGWSEHNAVLAAYNQVDLALDTFPFSGCATSGDALWMGVPVITIMGATRAGRQTASLLDHAGFDDWIARDVDDYVDRACRTALSAVRDPEQRRGQRRRFMSRVGDSAEFSAALEAILKTAAMDIGRSDPHVDGLPGIGSTVT